MPGPVHDRHSHNALPTGGAALDQRFENSIQRELTYTDFLAIQSSLTPQERNSIAAIQRTAPSQLTYQAFMAAYLHDTDEQTTCMLRLAQSYDQQRPALGNSSSRAQAKHLKQLLSTNNANAKDKAYFYHLLNKYTELENKHQQLFIEFQKQSATFLEIKATFNASTTIRSGLGDLYENVLETVENINALIGLLNRTLGITVEKINAITRLRRALTTLEGLAHLPDDDTLNRLLDIASQSPEINQSCENLKTKITSLRHNKTELPYLYTKRLAATWDQLSQKLHDTYQADESLRQAQQKQLFEAHRLMLTRIETSGTAWIPESHIAALKLYHNLLVFEARHHSLGPIRRWLHRHEHQQAEKLRQSSQSFLSGLSDIHTLATTIQTGQKRSRPNWLLRLFGVKPPLHYRILSQARVGAILNSASDEAGSDMPANINQQPLFVDCLDRWFPELNPATRRRSFRGRQPTTWDNYRFTPGDTSILASRKIPPSALLTSGVYQHLLSSDHEALDRYKAYFADALADTLPLAHRPFESTLAHYSQLINDKLTIRYREKISFKRALPLKLALDKGLAQKVSANEDCSHILPFIRFNANDIQALLSTDITLTQLIHSGLIEQIYQAIGVSANNPERLAAIQVLKHSLVQHLKTNDHHTAEAAIDALKKIESICIPRKDLTDTLFFRNEDLLDEGGVAHPLLAHAGPLHRETIKFFALLSPEKNGHRNNDALGCTNILTHHFVDAVQQAKETRYHLQETLADYEARLIEFSKHTTLSPEAFQARIQPLLDSRVKTYTTNQHTQTTGQLVNQLASFYWAPRFGSITTPQALITLANQLKRADLNIHESLQTAINHTFDRLIQLLPAELNAESKHQLCLLDQTRKIFRPTLGPTASNTLKNLRHQYLEKLLAENRWDTLQGHQEDIQVLHNALGIGYFTLKEFIYSHIVAQVNSETPDYSALHEEIKLFKNASTLLPNDMTVAQLYSNDQRQMTRLAAQLIQDNQLELLKELSGAPATKQLLINWTHEEQFKQVSSYIKRVTAITNHERQATFLVPLIASDALKALVAYLKATNQLQAICQLLTHSLKIQAAEHQNSVINQILESTASFPGILTQLLENKQYQTIKNLLHTLDNRDLYKGIIMPLEVGRKKTKRVVIKLKRSDLKKIVVLAVQSHLEALAELLNSNPTYAKLAVSRVGKQIFVSTPEHMNDFYTSITASILDRLPESQSQPDINEAFNLFDALLHANLDPDEGEEEDPYKALIEIDEHLNTPQWAALQHAYPGSAHAYERKILQVIESHILSKIEQAQDYKSLKSGYLKLATALGERSLAFQAILQRESPQLVEDINKKHTETMLSHAVYTAIQVRSNNYLNQSQGQPGPAQVDSSLDEQLKKFETGELTFIVPNNTTTRMEQNYVRRLTLTEDLLTATDTNPSHTEDPYFKRVKALLHAQGAHTPESRSRTNTQTSLPSLFGPRSLSPTSSGASSPAIDTARHKTAIHIIETIISNIEEYGLFNIYTQHDETWIKQSRLDLPTPKALIHDGETHHDRPLTLTFSDFTKTLSAEMTGIVNALPTGELNPRSSSLYDSGKLIFEQALLVARHLTQLKTQLSQGKLDPARAAQLSVTLLYLHQYKLPTDDVGDDYSKHIHQQITHLRNDMSKSGLEISLSEQAYEQHLSPLITKERKKLDESIKKLRADITTAKNRNDVGLINPLRKALEKALKQLEKLTTLSEAAKKSIVLPRTGHHGQSFFGDHRRRDTQEAPTAAAEAAGVHA